jgi:molecular chaperone GrpE
LYIRALADAENLRDRTRREKELAQQLAVKSFAKDLLSIADILEIALNSVPAEAREDKSSTHLSNLFTGLNMTYSEMKNTFKRHGLEQFGEENEDFDPNRHQAMFEAPIPGKKPGTVATVTKKGYTLHGIVIRAAEVGIAK